MEVVTPISGITPQKTNMNLKIEPFGSMYLLLKMVIFQPDMLVFGGTWRIIQISKWLGSPPFKDHLGDLEGEQLYLIKGLTISMVTNHLLSGILQLT